MCVQGPCGLARQAAAVGRGGTAATATKSERRGAFGGAVRDALASCRGPDCGAQPLGRVMLSWVCAAGIPSPPMTRLARQSRRLRIVGDVGEQPCGLQVRLLLTQQPAAS